MRRFKEHQKDNQKDNQKNSAGFTLIELAVVITVIAVLTGVVSVNVDELNKTTRLSNALMRSLSDVRFAQETAMTHGRAVNVTINGASHAYEVRWADTGTLLTNPVGGGQLNIVLNQGEYQGVSMTQALNQVLTFLPSGQPLIGGAGFNERTVLTLNGRVAVVVYNSGLVAPEDLGGGGWGCGIC